MPEDIARYRERYRQGWDALRESRWRRMKGMGLINNELPALDRNGGPPYHFPEALKLLGAAEVNRSVPWLELNEAQREFQSVKMAIHAAMIDRMDREIGRVFDQLRAMQAMGNTLILFLSDNRASKELVRIWEDHYEEFGQLARQDAPPEPAVKKRGQAAAGNAPEGTRP